MDDITQTGASGGIGGLIGAFFSWLGFSKRIDNQDKRMDRLCDEVQYKDTCKATHEPLKEQLSRMEEKLDRLILK